MEWESGRRLKKATASGKSVSYTYDTAGLRTSKTYNGTKYSYAYAGDKLIWQGWGNEELYFFYNASGEPLEFWHYTNGTKTKTGYYYTNLQGDVVRIEDYSGNILASYKYDPWGKLLSSSGTYAAKNPLRYRGYYYDTETGFYYLQSRYYDPTVSRFINADNYASTGQGFLGYNMFAYCGNNPVSRADASGDRYVPVVFPGHKTVYNYDHFHGYHTDDRTHYSWGVYAKTDSPSANFDIFSMGSSGNVNTKKKFGLDLGGIEAGIGAAGGDYEYGSWRLECVTGEARASISTDYIGIKVGARLVRGVSGFKIPLPFTEKKLAINANLDLFGGGFELYYDIRSGEFKSGVTLIVGSGISVSLVD